MKKLLVLTSILALAALMSCPNSTASNPASTNILPVLTTAAVTNIGSSTATMGGNITSAGNPAYIERGVCWSTSTNPTITGNGNKAAASGAGTTGNFTVNVINLSASTFYFVRAYATNANGTAYGEQRTFSTGSGSGTGNLPALTTSEISNIGSSTATMGGNVVNPGNPAYYERGVCWGTEPDPDIYGSKLAAAGSGTTGSFTVTVYGLQASTFYYVRSYATNTNGTAYGDWRSFITFPEGSGYDPGGDDPSDTIYINNASDMEKLRTYPSGKFVITSDIAMSGTWTPVSYDPPFTGSLDGKDHKITGLVINSSNHAGLFISIKDAVIKNLTIDSGSLSSGGQAGMIASYVEHSTIENVHILNGSVTNTDVYNTTGGIAGIMDNSTIKDCTVSAVVTGKNDTGGIVGSASRVNPYTNQNIITGCIVTGKVTGGRGIAGNSNTTCAGGIAGYAIEFEISKCSTSGELDGAARVGGIIGEAGIAGPSTISECVSTGLIYGSLHAGGIAGYIYNLTISNCYSKGNVGTGGQITHNSSAGGIAGYVSALLEINNCYASGIRVSGYNSGGIVGFTDTSTTIKNSISMASDLGDMLSRRGRILGYGTATFQNNYANSAFDGSDDANGGNGQGNPLSTYESSSFYTSNLPTWEFGTVWKMGSPYPVLAWEE